MHREQPTCVHGINLAISPTRRAVGVTFSPGGQRCRSGDIAALLRRQPRSHVRPHNGAGRHCEAAAGHNGWMAPVSSYVTRPLSPDTWDDFARLVEANNGVWGGCWCMGFHPEGVGKGHTVSGNRLAKQAHVRNGTVHQILVYDGDECVGWCSTGRRPSHRTSTTRKPMPRAWARCPTGGSVASSLAAGTGAVGCAGGSQRRAGRHPRCWRRPRRGLPRASRGARPAARRLFPYRPGRPVRGVRLRAGPEDSEMAVGDAAANPVLTESCRFRCRSG